MKLLPEMLAEWVTTDLTPEQIADLLTMTGFELEEILEVEGEPVLDVNIMANRGDGASVMGLAREVQAKVGGATEKFRTYAAPDRAPGFGADASSGNATDHIVIDSELCARFAILALDDVRNGPSPEWLQSRLRRMGQRPISLLVDLTNYVMLELGQPLHAYDADKLSGGVFIVREAKAGET
ncbi:phenylalanine--tRNA ligase subunit beta, partial [bacterium]